MAVRLFGSGTLWMSRTDLTGQAPLRVGGFQGMETNVKFSQKKMYSQYQFPDAIANSEGDITGKFKIGVISTIMIATMMFAQSVVTTINNTADQEAHTVPAASPYTVSVANAATFNQDLGVVYAATGLPLTLVASAPTVGQYAYNSATGVYTFAAADEGAAVLISYGYSVVSGGSGFTLPNTLQGIQPVFQAKTAAQWQSPNGLKKGILQLNACIPTSFSFPFKMGDFAYPEMEFGAFADQSGNIMSWYANENS